MPDKFTTLLWQFDEGSHALLVTFASQSLHATTIQTLKMVQIRPIQFYSL